MEAGIAASNEQEGILVTSGYELPAKCEHRSKSANLDSEAIADLFHVRTPWAITDMDANEVSPSLAKSYTAALDRAKRDGCRSLVRCDLVV